jgi:hypothetical protein
VVLHSFQGIIPFSEFLYELFIQTGLNNSIKYLEKSGLDLHNYNYSDEYLEAVVRGMKEVQFQGISVSLIKYI